MLESMDVGFRGMSGAVAVNENGKCVGMFVKRGKLISLKPPRMVTAEGTSAMKYEDTEETMGFATAVPAASQSSWFEQLLFPSCKTYCFATTCKGQKLKCQVKIRQPDCW